jgi:hypothetical protein
MALAPPLVRAKQRIEAAKAIVILRMSSTQLLFEATKDKRLEPKIGSSSSSSERIDPAWEMRILGGLVGYARSNEVIDRTTGPEICIQNKQPVRITFVLQIS